jgi:hypothetical protein
VETVVVTTPLDSSAPDWVQDAVRKAEESLGGVPPVIVVTGERTGIIVVTGEPTGNGPSESSEYLDGEMADLDGETATWMGRQGTMKGYLFNR